MASFKGVEGSKDGFGDVACTELGGVLGGAERGETTAVGTQSGGGSRNRVKTCIGAKCETRA